MTARRIAVAFAALALLAAAVLPACVTGMCCKSSTNHQVSLHASMPCCKGENSMAPREAKPAPPATFAILAQVPDATPVVTTLVPAVRTLAVASIDLHRESPPSAYLLHEQFRI